MEHILPIQGTEQIKNLKCYCDKINKIVKLGCFTHFNNFIHFIFALQIVLSTLLLKWKHYYDNLYISDLLQGNE